MPIKQPGDQNWDVRIATIEARLESFDGELRQQGRRQDEGFDRIDRTLTQLFGKVETATSKPPPWGVIVSGMIGIATIVLGIGGLGLTIATGLAIWANAYFGSSIRNAETRARDVHERLDKTVERVDAKMEMVQTFGWQNRAAILSWQDASRGLVYPSLRPESVPAIPSSVSPSR